MELKDKTIALLIDSDNVSREYYAILLDELSKYGRVTYRRLYGDFSKPKSNGWKSVLLEFSIEQVQQIAYTTGKNASDSSMIIDAMDILYKGKVDCFCLATSDSDFTGLAMRFRNDNLVVIGAGEDKTPDSFRKACDRFIPISELRKAQKDKDAEALQPVQKAEPAVPAKGAKPKKKAAAQPPAEKTEAKLARIIEIAKEVLVDGAEADGSMHFSAFMNEVYRKENEFNPKLYEHNNSSPSSFFKSIADGHGRAIFVLEKIGQIFKIRLC